MTIIKSPQFKLTLGTSDFESNELKPLVHLIVVEQNSPEID